MSKLEEGKPAPDFSLPAADGKEFRLSSLKGKQHAVLYFYPKDDTPGCTQEACDFRDHSKKFQDLKAIILGVSADSVKSHEKFRDKFKLPFSLLSDEDHKVIERYGVWKEKSMYGKKYMGIERTTVVIDKAGIVRRIFPKVKVAGHFDEVLAALKEIESPQPARVS